MDAGLAAVLLQDDLAPGDQVDLAEVGVRRLDVPPPPVGAARPGRPQLTHPDGAEIGGADLVGRLVPVAGSHLERPEGGGQDLVDVLEAGGATGTSAAGNTTLIAPSSGFRAHRRRRLLRRGRRAELAAAKQGQARLLGECLLAANRDDWSRVADALDELADLEEQLDHAFTGGRR
jgi:sugar phosphate isomerase/epimerase